jgi:threonine dehydrogenase-like Zn-dependent dehydrogenase
MNPELNNSFVHIASPGVVEIVEETLPSALTPDYVRLKVAFCGICGGDYSSCKGRSDVTYPLTIGHEYYGSIVEVGGNVAGFHPGDLVAVDPNYRCGRCDYCKTGKSNFCELSGSNLFRRRGLSNYVDIHCSYLHHLVPLSPDFLGALIEPLSCALQALALANIEEDEQILILGCGGQGTMLSFALSCLRPTLTIDVFDINLPKSENLSVTFPDTIIPLKEPPPEGAYSLVIEASGQSAGFNFASRSVLKGGKIIVISRYYDQMVTIPDDFPRRGCEIIFSHLNGNGEPFIHAMDLISKFWKKSYNKLIKIESLFDIEEVLKNHDNSPHGKIIIKVN